jgi:hypothetical protein
MGITILTRTAADDADGQISLPVVSSGWSKLTTELATELATAN